MAPVRQVLVLSALLMVGGACNSGHPAEPATAPTSAPAIPASASSAMTTATCSTATSTAPGHGSKEVNPPGDIPDNQAYVAFSPADGAYTVKVPEGWARTDASGTVSFTDKFNTVRIDVVAAPQKPTVQSAQTDELPRLAATVRCFGGGRVTTITRRSGPAVLITYQADSSADSVTGKVVRDDVERYEFWRAGHEAILTLSGATGSDNVDPWRLVTDSFAWR